MRVQSAVVSQQAWFTGPSWHAARSRGQWPLMTAMQDWYSNFWSCEKWHRSADGEIGVGDGKKGCDGGVFQIPNLFFNSVEKLVGLLVPPNNVCKGAWMGAHLDGGHRWSDLVDDPAASPRKILHQWICQYLNYYSNIKNRTNMIFNYVKICNMIRNNNFV